MDQEALSKIVRGEPAHRFGCRPERAEVGVRHDARPSHGGPPFGSALVDRIVVLLGDGKVDDITDPEVLGLDCRGQRAVEAGEFEVLFAAEDGELLAPCQDVDHLTIADDVQPVDRHGFGVGRPDERDVARRGQGLRRPHQDDALGVMLVLILSEARLSVLEQKLGGDVGGRRRLGNGDRDHPFRRRPVLELIGRPRAARGQDAGSAKQNPGYHAHPPQGTIAEQPWPLQRPAAARGPAQFEGLLT